MNCSFAFFSCSPHKMATAHPRSVFQIKHHLLITVDCYLRLSVMKAVSILWGYSASELSQVLIVTSNGASLDFTSVAHENGPKSVELYSTPHYKPGQPEPEPRTSASSLSCDEMGGLEFMGWKFSQMISRKKLTRLFFSKQDSISCKNVFVIKQCCLIFQ